jgi:predicted metalloprotease with PDZ domain
MEQPVIEYRLKPVAPEAHLLEVHLRIETPDPHGQRLYLPAWIRGSYMVRDFARNLVTLRASSQTGEIETRKLDKQTWLVPPVAGPLDIVYSIYAWDLSVRAAHVDTTHAYFNGPYVFLAVAGFEKESCRVEFQPPDGSGYADWQLAIALPPVSVNDAGFGLYQANNYDALIDAPAEMGNFESTSFEVLGKPHRFVVSGRQRTDLERISRDMTAICSEEAALFDDLPISSYLFLLWVVGDGYGGLEHCNSTSLMISRDDLPPHRMEKMTKGYRRLLGLCSHEYFHLWHVKRITPEVFQRQGTDKEVYTRQLWVFEGITSYYDELILVRSGVIDRENYFEMLAETITRVMRGSGRFKQTLEESSFDAWTKFYKQDENAPNAIVSYYAKGALLAMLLDLKIRERSEGEKSLDDVMRALWQRHGKTSTGLPEGAFESIAQQVTGLDLTEFFAWGVRSTRDLQLAEGLTSVGVELHLLPAKSSTDMGGLTDKMPLSNKAKPVLGVKWRQQAGSVLIQQVFDGGAAQRAGLSAGDEVIALNGLRMDAGQMENFIGQIETGECVTLHLFRRDELMQFNVLPLEAPADTATLFLPDTINDQQRMRREAWLTGYAKPN